MTDILLLALILFASLIGTVTGFGTSTILVPILALIYPLPEVLLFVGVIHWFGNLWKMYFFRQGRSWRLLLSFGLVGIIGSVIGARLTVSISQDVLQKLLGVFLIGYAVFIFWKPSLKLTPTPVFTTIGGMLSGVSSGIFGVGGAIRGVFLNAFGLKKAMYLFTAGAIGFLIDSGRIVTYWQQGYALVGLHTNRLIIAIPLSLLGAWLAKKLVDYVPEKLFRQLVLVGLAVIGGYFILR